MAEVNTARQDEGTSIQRRDLEVVIRRALELAGESADPEEQLSEDEVLRIGAELGLAPEHVMRALVEAPGAAEATSLTHRLYGSGRVVGARLVPFAGDIALHTLEEYLTTREYLQIQRRFAAGLRLAPAEDTLSGLFRAFRRPASRYTLSRARRVDVNVRTSAGGAVVCVGVDLRDRRRSAARGGVAGGALLGTGLGAGVFFAVGSAAVALGGSGLEVALAASTAGVVGLAATVSASMAMSASRFQQRVARTRGEIDALLDRLERREQLDPPPAPWLRGLRTRTLRAGSG